MTVFEVIVTASVNVVTGGIVYLYKDKKKSDTDYLATINDRLSKEIDRLDKQNEALSNLIATEKEEKAKVVTARDNCLQKVHELEIADQKKSNEITLLRIKNPNSTFQ